jgi:hypothetical protein
MKLAGEADRIATDRLRWAKVKLANIMQSSAFEVKVKVSIGHHNLTGKQHGASLLSRLLLFLALERD